MSTRSRIGKLLPDGKVLSIYCHYDGYPTGVGMMLLKNYDKNNIDKLLALGDISSLGKNPEPLCKHPESQEYYEDSKNYCNTYSDKSKAIIMSSEKDYVLYSWDYSDAEYVYLFKNDKWYFANTDRDTEVKELEPVLLKTRKY